MAGQKLTEIRALLDGAGLAPQHRYGQNFLIDLNLMRKLVSAAELSPGDVALEVGAGTGSLTELLLESGARVVAVEIDRGLQRLLRERLGGHPRLTLVQGDALAAKSQVNPLVLKLLAERPPGTTDSLPECAAHRIPGDPEGTQPAPADDGSAGKEDAGPGEPVDRALDQENAVAGRHDTPVFAPQDRHGRGTRAGNYKLVSNLPYQIATPLIIDLLLVEPRFERMVCTIQKEVGEKLVAEPRTEEYGPVSIILQTLADIRPLAILPSTAFWPRPQIESIMVLIRPRPAEQIELPAAPLNAAAEPGLPSAANIPGFVEFVRTAFQQRRKVLRRLFREWTPATALAVFQKAHVNPEARPEELSPATWRALFAAKCWAQV